MTISVIPLKELRGPVDKINLAAQFARFADHWNLRIVGELNGQRV